MTLMLLATWCSSGKPVDQPGKPFDLPANQLIIPANWLRPKRLLGVISAFELFSYFQV
jgi:hypothetical protein